MHAFIIKSSGLYDEINLIIILDIFISDFIH